MPVAVASAIRLTPESHRADDAVRGRTPMSWERWRADNLAGWEDRVPIHTGPGGYDVAGLLADPKRLSATVRHDREALGPLDRARRRAPAMPSRHRHPLAAASRRGVGLGPRLLAARDRPLPVAVRTRRRRRPFRRGRRVRCRAAARPALRPGLRLDRRDQLDPVDRSLAAVAASLLEPGGRLYLRDVHPMAMAIDPTTDLELRLRYPYGEQTEPVTLHDDQTYCGRRHAGRASDHPRVVARPRRDRPGRARRRAGGARPGRALLHRVADARVDGQGRDDRWVLPEAPERLPLLFTLQATRSVDAVGQGRRIDEGATARAGRSDGRRHTELQDQVTKKGAATYSVPGSTYEDAFAFFAKMNAAKKEWAIFHHETPTVDLLPTRANRSPT